MLQLSPLTKRRWQIFRSQRRGYLSAIVLMGLIACSMGAEFIANSRPIVVRYAGDFYFPLFKTYAETTFGGDFDTEAEYSDPFIADRLEASPNWAVWPLIRFDYKTVDFDLQHPAPSPPSSAHWLGTDDRARDILARLVYGFRLSVLFGIALAVFGSLLGIIVGALQGYIGGTFDLLGQRLIEIWGSQNELYLLIILSSLLTPSLALIFVLLSLFGWMGLAAYVRAEFLRARNYEYVESAVALGAKTSRVIGLHILPNTLTPVITFFPFRVSAAIMGLTALDFLGLGVPPPTASLGELLAQGKANLQSWWIIVAVFTVLVATIMLLNFIGEALRRSMDPNVIR